MVLQAVDHTYENFLQLGIIAQHHSYEQIIKNRLHIIIFDSIENISTYTNRTQQLQGVSQRPQSVRQIKLLRRIVFLRNVISAPQSCC